MKVKSIAECSLGASGSLMGPGTRCFTYQCVQLQTYESRTLFLMLGLQYHGWASAELPRNRVNVNVFLRHIRDLSR